MLKTLFTRMQQGRRTLTYPKAAPTLPERFRGRPVFDAAACTAGCSACCDVCPTGAISAPPSGPDIDLGRCLFCTACTDACTAGRLRYSKEHRLAVRCREDLHVRPEAEYRLAAELEEQMLRLFGRALRLRQVSAGGCNGCEVDVNVLTTIVFDLSRFGIQIVASPRHADGLLITGPISANMRLAVEKTYAAVPAPKLVIACGACAIGGGPFEGHPEVLNGAGAILPVDLYIPGCPPHPITILDGLLRLLGRAA